MTPQERKVMELALEALRMPIKFWNKTQYIKVQEAIEVAEKALAKTEQEPATKEQIREAMIFNLPLYTTPPQRKPLSDEEMKKIWYAMQNIMGWYSFQEIARAIEAAHNIKE